MFVHRVLLALVQVPYNLRLELSARLEGVNYQVKECKNTLWKLM